MASHDDPALQTIQGFIDKLKVDKGNQEWRTGLNEPPQASFPDGKTYFWNIETSHGNLKVKLLPEVAPMHVSSTIYLAMLGFYDDLKFHRVISGFMAQGGCPLGAGHGGPGYQYDGECSPAVRHDRPGLLSMANTGQARTDGSQFFLTFVPTPHLDGKHTIFGEVVDGLDTTLKTLEKHGSSSGQTSEPMFMKKTTISVE